MRNNQDNKNYTSDSEFLQDVYQKIEVLKDEEREMEKIRAAKRKSLKKRFKLASAALLINLPFIIILPEMISQNNQALIMGWCFLLMTIGSFFQYSSENRERC